MIDFEPPPASRRGRGAEFSSTGSRPLASPEFADRSGFDLADQLRDQALTPAAASLRRELEGRFRSRRLDDLDDDDREILLMRFTSRA